MHNFIKERYYFANKFNKKIIDKTGKHTSIIYRNYDEKINILNVIKLKNYCKKINKKIYLSNNVKLALSLGLDGAYIPSFNNKMKHLSFSLKKNFKLIGSAHNLKEIRIKEKQKVSKIFLSSLFKKNKNYLGFYKLKLISKLTKKKVVVLGGISKNNIKKLKLLENPEIAGISFFE